MAYRISRNIEASIIDYLSGQLTLAGWTNITIEKTFARIYDIPVDAFENTGAICVRVSNTTHEKAEIGADSTVRTPSILIDIFANNDGQRLDLKDFLVSILKSGMPYYEYVITSGAVSSKIQNGRIRILTLDDDIVNLGIDKSALAIYDRYRHLLALSISLGRVEV